jgi:hypothetical protein
MPIGIGQAKSNKITTIFDHKISIFHRGKAHRSKFERMHLADPVICSDYRVASSEWRDHLILRTEASINNVIDYGVREAIDYLPSLRTTLSRSTPTCIRTSSKPRNLHRRAQL